jgi:hypothetical protein
MANPVGAAVGAPRFALWGVERFVLRFYLWGAVLLIALLLVNELSLFGRDLRQWDWLFVSGVLVFVATLRLALELPDRVEQALVRVGLRGVLAGEAADLRALSAGVHRSARRISVLGSSGAALLMILAWIIARGSRIGSYGPTVTAETLGAALAGLFIGRIVGYGMLGRRIQRTNLRIAPEPQDFDGAAGLRPIGSLYLFQASLVAVPAAFLAVWWFLIPVFGNRYDSWRNVYAGLTVVMVALEGIAFVAPMLSFHTILHRAKLDLLVEADRYNQEAAGLRERLVDVTGEDRGVLVNRLEWLEQRYHAIEAMPVWPVDIRIRRRFTISNALILLPLALQAVGLSGPWDTLIAKLGSIGS